MHITTSLPRLLVPLSVALLVCIDARAASPDESFDREAAASALSSVDVAKCKSKKTPLGEGHVIVTYAPSGAAQAAIVDRGPFVGTKAEKCISKEFKRSRVPAFKGEPVSVGKNFKIE